MKILNKVEEHEIPRGVREPHGHYKPIVEHIKALKIGSYLPIECADIDEAKRLVMWAYTHRSIKMTVKRRGLTVYIRRGE